MEQKQEVSLEAFEVEFRRRIDGLNSMITLVLDNYKRIQDENKELKSEVVKLKIDTTAK